MKKANHFQIEKVQFQSVASLLLNFLLVSALCCLTIKVFLIKKACSSCCRVLLNYNACKKIQKQPFNKKGRNLLVPSIQYCQFGQDDRKNRIFSGR